MANQDLDLTTTTGMHAYLNASFHPCLTVTKVVSAGHSAWVFRGTLATPLPGPTSSNDKTVIIKHVQEFAARTFDIKLDPGRMDYEARGLRTLKPLLERKDTGGDSCKLPRVLHYDSAEKVLILEDLGNPRTLKVWVTASMPVDRAESVGRKLGTWLADLHELAKDDAGRGVIEQFAGHTNGRELSAMFIFGQLAATAARFGFTDSFIAEAADVASKEVLEASEVLTMGDFWTGNILITDGAVGEGSEVPECYVVDWELAKPGTASYDVGQMAAEMYFMMKFSDAEKAGVLLRSFLDSYTARRHVDPFKVAIRVGAHMVVVGQMTKPDATKEEIRNLVEEGVAFVKAGWQQDYAFVKASVLAPLLKE